MEDVQTESNTPDTLAKVPDPDPDYGCFVKAKEKGEPTFTLRAQDVTAPVLVRAWALIQIHVGIDVDNGFTVEAAVQRIEELLGIALSLPDGVEAEQLANNPKIEQAMVTAQAMQQWPNRKVPD